jgi:hypothetical protein
MNVNVSDSERDFLLELLDARHTSMLRELHHTDTNDYKKLLSRKVDLLEKLKDKLKNATSTTTNE